MKLNQILKLTLLAVLLLSSTVFAKNDSTQAILKLDTKGHTGLIKDIIVTKDGDIISASVDKTIRVYDKNGKEERKILGQIGAGSGEIFAIALSKDERYLAVGGFMAFFKGSNHQEIGSIRIYNYKTGKLLQVLKSHTNVVLDLAFSSDNNKYNPKSLYLISGSGDKTAKIWTLDKNDKFTLKDTIKFHTNHVYAVKIINRANNYFAITTGYDNKIALYDIQKRKIINSHKLNYKLNSLAVSKNHIAVCGYGKEIVVYDFNLQKLKTIKSETTPEGLAYNNKGNYLIAGFNKHPYNVNVYNKKKTMHFITHSKNIKTQL